MRLLIILKPARENPAVCARVCVRVPVLVCVTGRLVATGGGKQVDLYSFDHPGGRRWLRGVSARRLEGGGKWREKLSVFQHKSVCCRACQYVCS